MELELKGKVALITGGAGGIGYGTCEVFAQEGANLVMNYHNPNRKEEREKMAKDLADKYGVKVLAVLADVAKEEDVVRIFDEAEKFYGQTIDIVVNNAANITKEQVGTSGGAIEDFNVSNFRVSEATMIEAAMLTSREIVRRNKPIGKPGWIVNVLSKSAFWTSSVHNTNYITCKGALNHFTRGLAHEIARDNFWVNAVIPGYVSKPTTDYESQRYKRTVQYIPLHRYGKPQELGRVIAFLCSPAAYLVNGVTVDCTAGTMTGASPAGPINDLRNELKNTTANNK